MAQAMQAGTVVDSKTGEPIAEASVFAGSGEATSDDAGGFSLPDVPAGRVDVVVVADGYQPYYDQLVSGRAWRIRLVADATLGSGETVEIVDVAPPPESSPTYALGQDALKSLPGSGNDALKSLQSLPGVSRVPFGLGGLALRGSAPRDTMVVLDGVRVPLLYHFGGLASFLPSSKIQSLQLENGNFSARWGRAQGGLVEITSAPGRADRWRVGGEVSLLDASAVAEGPGGDDGSWSFGVRRSYVDAILAGIDLDLTLAPRYLDAQARYETGGVPSEGRFLGMLFASDDKLTLTRGADGVGDDDDSFSYISRFVRAVGRYQRSFGALDFSSTLSAGADDVQLKVDDNAVIRRNFPIALRTDVTRRGDHGWIAGGLDLELTRHRFSLGNDPPPGAMPGAMMDTAVRADTLWSGNAAVWLESLWRQGCLTVKPGVRGEYYALADQFVLDPRLTVLQDLGDGVTLSQAIGLYHQPPSVVDLDPAFGNQDLDASSAWHAAVGIDVPVGKPTQPVVTVSATGFYRDMNDLAVDVVSAATPIAAGGSGQSGGVGGISRELSEEQFGSYSMRDNVGSGKSYGLELMAKKTTGAWQGWLSYTYGRSLRRGDPARQLGWEPYVLDQPHVLTALVQMPLGSKWQVGARFRLATGNPITPADGAYFDATEQEYVPFDGDVLSERLPDYWQLDVRVDRVWKRKWGTIKGFLDLQNATNRVNPEGVSYNYDYTEREYTRGLPIFPSIGVEYIP